MRDRNAFTRRHFLGAGTLVQAPNGNLWVSTGHSHLAIDLSGQDWLVTHGIDRRNPYLFGSANARPMLINRLDWIDGWPTTRAGQWLPAGPAPAPQTDARIADAFEGGDSLGDTWQPSPGWEVRREPAGGYVHTDATADERVLHAERTLHSDVRVRGAVRMGTGEAGSAGFVLSARGAGSVRVQLDRAERVLVVEMDSGSRAASRTVASLPDSFRYEDWHELATARFDSLRFYRL